MKIIKTPWKRDFLGMVSASKKSIKITSPFIKENICTELLSAKSNNVKLEVITSFKLMNIYAGALDTMGLEKILAQKGVVKNYPKLHAKIYLFDDEKVVISSGNLTNGGLLNNYEYGIYSNESALVNQVVADFNMLSKHENTGKVKQSDIDTVRKIIATLPKSKGITLPNIELASPEEQLDVIDIPKQVFTLKDVSKYKSKLQSIYPSNQHVMDKVRQQLQYLRDLGLIEFLGNGSYKKLWNDSASSKN
ncbi:MAG: hypothetical protein EAY81_05785 [Bacteroidetes bacterium]|nr:MAG: hypothetical protein EAY81_05785 [Bacteroidota bacterium]